MNLHPMHPDVRQVLADLIREATSRTGALPEGVTPDQWIAERFLAWWGARVHDECAELDKAIVYARAELGRLGGWSNKGLEEVMHAMIHVGDANAELRLLLGVETP